MPAEKSLFERGVNWKGEQKEGTDLTQPSFFAGEGSAVPYKSKDLTWERSDIEGDKRSM